MPGNPVLQEFPAQNQRQNADEQFREIEAHSQPPYIGSLLLPAPKCTGCLFLY